MTMQVEGDWLDSAASRRVMDALEAGGARGYFVGGCVRNALLGAPVRDLDIATDARPERVMALARSAGLKAVPTGIDHGTVTVVAGHVAYEVTTFRRDIRTDGRRAQVVFSTRLERDALRRDFTMNALYCDRSGVVTDPLGGLEDLKARRVRFIEDADKRIAEDYLRILRFFRFHAWYGDAEQGLDAQGLAACAAATEGIATLSKERIGAEMIKLLAAPDPAPSVAAMAQAGVLSRVLSGADHRALAPLVHLEAVAGLEPAWVRRLAVLGGQDVAKSLRLSRRAGKHLIAIGAVLAAGLTPAEAGYRYGQDIATDAGLVAAAATGVPLPGGAMAAVLRGATAEFPVKAADLSAEFRGRALGEKLKELEEIWIKSGFRTTRAELLH
jgi:poly(A) polymerase